MYVCSLKGCVCLSSLIYYVHLPLVSSVPIQSVSPSIQYAMSVCPLTYCLCVCLSALTYSVNLSVCLYVFLLLPILCICLLSLQCVLCPHSLRIDKLTLPRLDVTIQVWNQLVLVVAHAGTEMSDADVCLLRPPSQEYKFAI